MRKILAMLMICILLAPVMGTLAVFHLYRYQIRKEVTEIIIRGMKEEWVDLAFSSSEIKTKLKWKHSREFEFEGQMYDIVEQRIEGDTVIYTCYKDDKETRLNQELDKTVARALGQDPVQKNRNERLANFFKNLYQPGSCIWSPTSFSPSTLTFEPCPLNYLSLYIIPPSPPPKQA
ncbi:MAG: hypothetical protein K0B08_08530 [Bacteroidales bacterium]|nr:hypothetical protein [Bacteroidales bacterium]